MKNVQLFINGNFRDSSDKNTIKTTDPSNNEVIAEVQIPSGKDIDDAVTAAHHAFYESDWRDYDAAKRSEILLKTSELIKERRKELIEWEIKDSGSTYSKAAADVHNSASYFKVLSKSMMKFDFGPTLDERASREGFSKNYLIHEPVGVCAQIIPWNFPLVMAAWKIGPIIASGCTTVLKSALETPISATILAQILKDAGLPDGVVNIITGGAKEGQTLLDHKHIRKVAFTGSTEVGKTILKNSSEKMLNTTLELGGKSPNIILKDADLDIAIDGALYAFLYHQGQACDSGTRLLVHDEIYDEFKERLVKRIADIGIGPTSEKSSAYGPMVNEVHMNRVMSYIEKTKEEGAPLLYGGERITEGDLEKGYFISPTIFEITPDNTIWHEEIFGPVVGLTRFKSTEEAIQLANHSNYGLAGAVWGQDEKEINQIVRELEAGTIWVNEFHLLNPGMPFGGFKMSGIGREMGEKGLLAYLEPKHLWVSDCNQRESKPWFDVIFKK